MKKVLKIVSLVLVFSLIFCLFSLPTKAVSNDPCPRCGALAVMTYGGGTWVNVSANSCIHGYTGQLDFLKKFTGQVMCNNCTYVFDGYSYRLFCGGDGRVYSTPGSEVLY